MSDLPLHRTMQDDEIDRLKARVAELVEALERIASWRDGGNRSGQPHIKMFAAKTLSAHRKQETSND